MKASGFSYKFRQGVDPQQAGGRPPKYSLSIEDGMVIERDVPVSLRDGTRIYVDVFRPQGEAKVPPLIAWSPYGKHAAITYDVFPNAGVKKEWVSRYTAFEAPDPVYWTRNGYAVINVDPRGAWYSEGKLTIWSSQEAQDYHDLVEWAGTQEWSNGKVGLSGVSYLSISQYAVAATNPPHLAAINPWEGLTDPYRDVARHGGIPDTWFWPFIQQCTQFTAGEHEDIVAMAQEHPLYDAYWADKKAPLEQIRVPAYVVASWSDQGLHTRGTLEAFEKMNSQHKWLEVHGQKKWEYYYKPENVAKQKAFFDRFLKGQDDSFSSQPKVLLEVRDAFGTGEFTTQSEWPIPGTQYVKYFLNAADGSASIDPQPDEAAASYDSVGKGTEESEARFEISFDLETDVIGTMALKLWVEAPDADDLDLFIAVDKIRIDGTVAHFAFYSQFEDGHAALGWLRASHRALSDDSTETKPRLAHQREEKIPPGTIVPVYIEIWPSGTRFAKGERLRVTVRGSDTYRYAPNEIAMRHENTVNKGRHVIHSGGKYDSHVLVPIVSKR